MNKEEKKKVDALLKDNNLRPVGTQSIHVDNWPTTWSNPPNYQNNTISTLDPIVELHRMMLETREEILRLHGTIQHIFEHMIHNNTEYKAALLDVANAVEDLTMELIPKLNP